MSYSFATHSVAKKSSLPWQQHVLFLCNAQRCKGSLHHAERGTRSILFLCNATRCKERLPQDGVPCQGHPHAPTSASRCISSVNFFFLPPGGESCLKFFLEATERRLLLKRSISCLQRSEAFLPFIVIPATNSLPLVNSNHPVPSSTPHTLSPVTSQSCWQHMRT